MTGFTLANMVGLRHRQENFVLIFYTRSTPL
jgi:hypothetical protein